jgi:GTPase SAR1 family protein
MFYDNTEYQLALFHIENNKQNVIHIGLIGDKNIGKSKIIKQFQLNKQNLHLKFYQIDLIYQNKNNLISISPSIDCLLLVFDINNQISFDHLIDRCLPLIQTSQSVYSLSEILANYFQMKSKRNIT